MHTQFQRRCSKRQAIKCAWNSITKIVVYSIMRERERGRENLRSERENRAGDKQTCAESAFHSRNRLFTSLVMCFSLQSLICVRVLLSESAREKWKIFWDFLIALQFASGNCPWWNEKIRVPLNNIFFSHIKKSLFSTNIILCSTGQLEVNYPLDYTHFINLIVN